MIALPTFILTKTKRLDTMIALPTFILTNIEHMKYTVANKGSICLLVRGKGTVLMVIKRIENGSGHFYNFALPFSDSVCVCVYFDFETLMYDKFVPFSKVTSFVVSLCSAISTKVILPMPVNI